MEDAQGDVVAGMRPSGMVGRMSAKHLPSPGPTVRWTKVLVSSIISNPASSLSFLTQSSLQKSQQDALVTKATWFWAEAVAPRRLASTSFSSSSLSFTLALVQFSLQRVSLHLKEEIVVFAVWRCFMLILTPQSQLHKTPKCSKHRLFWLSFTAGIDGNAAVKLG